MALHNPLSDEVRAKLAEHEKNIPNLKEELARAKRAGLDVGVQEELLKVREQELKKFMQEFR